MYLSCRSFMLWVSGAIFISMAGPGASLPLFLLVHVTRDLGVVRAAGERFLRFLPQLERRVPELGRDLARFGDFHRERDVFRHEPERETRVELAVEDELRELVLGAVVAAGRRVDDVDQRLRLDPKA